MTFCHHVNPVGLPKSASQRREHEAVSLDSADAARMQPPPDFGSIGSRSHWTHVLEGIIAARSGE